MPRGSVGTAVLALVLVLAVGCTTDVKPAATSGGPPDRTYWPTQEWRTADPAEHGLDADEVDFLESTVASEYPSMRSMAIVRDGYLIYEHYWQGLDETDGHDVRAVTRSVVGALVGIALADGSIKSLDATLGELFAGRIPAGADPRIADVTVRQLLSMTAGLPGDDQAWGGDGRVFERIQQSDNWVQAILSLPLTGDPGSAWAYSRATSHLLSAIVADATGASTLEFARDRLFRPLGIDTSEAYVPQPPATPEVVDRYDQASVAWPADPQGYNVGDAFLKLPTRELAKFGFLYLNEGRWDDQQVIPADYVRRSTTPESGTANAENGYGWQWFTEEEDHGAFAALGYGGQVIYVDPALDLVVVITCDPNAQIPAETVDFVGQVIVPHLES